MSDVERLTTRLEKDLMVDESVDVRLAVARLVLGLDAVRGAFAAQDGGDRVRELVRVVGAWSGTVAADAADLFGLLVYRPSDAAQLILDVHESAGRPYLTVVEVFEAAWLLVSTGSFPGMPPRPQRTGAPLLARSRHVLASLAFDPDFAAMVRADREGGDPGAAKSHARQVREDWLAFLDSHEDRAFLEERLGPNGVEVEILALLDQPIGPDGGDGDDRAVWRHCLERHLLPRFAVVSTARAVWRMVAPRTRGLLWLTAVPFAAAIVFTILGVTGVPISCAGGPFTLASGAAALVYVCLAAAATLDRVASFPALLRLPAAAVVGLLALASFNPSWWRSVGDADVAATWGAAAVMAAGAVGYLLVEAANHHVEGAARLVRRVMVVSLIGAAHAFMVSIIALRWVVPPLTEAVSLPGHDVTFAGWWQSDHLGVLNPLSLLAFATAWCFAAGVFLQMLWDDRPVTAPLGHIQWRRTS